MEDDVIVAHVPRTISTACYLFITRGGSIVCEITGNWRHSADLPQGGLELPCKMTFSGSNKKVAKARNLLKNSPLNSQSSCSVVTSNLCSQQTSTTSNHADCSINTTPSVLSSQDGDEPKVQFVVLNNDNSSLHRCFWL